SKFSPTAAKDGAIYCESVDGILAAVIGGNVYAYSDQLKKGFITLDGGIRVGIAGEYVTEGDKILTVKNVTSLNVRIPHDIYGCADGIFKRLFLKEIGSTLIYSPPGYGKTTILRDTVRKLSDECRKNVLLFDERNEIFASNGANGGLYLGERTDVICGSDKLTAFGNAIRSLKPQIIVCDELYGQRDFEAVNYAAECRIAVIASTHITQPEILKKLNFENFIELTGIGKGAVIYDKNFNTVCHCPTVGVARNNNHG
ncbi:MAG: hypothetical protein K2N47_03645, partial [Clostridia bacterium]|nr:hypothetical protein [Clostridia bacterium]